MCEKLFWNESGISSLESANGCEVVFKYLEQIYEGVLKIEDGCYERRVYLCSNSKKWDGAVVSERFGKKYSWYIGTISKSSFKFANDTREDYFEYFLLTGKKTKKKTFKFVIRKDVLIAVDSEDDSKILANIIDLSNFSPMFSAKNCLEDRGYNTSDYKWDVEGRIILNY